MFIPNKIAVGYQNRSDTFTGRLAYVIYYDEKGKLRKETSWNSWCSKDIPKDEYENEPTSGFVLNKKVGGYKSDWNFRDAYVRIYDPRGFEFEITVPNLLFILENTSAVKGKGLEGDFVYGWNGSDLTLIPTSCPDYVAVTAYSDMIKNPETIKSADLVLGGTYKTDKDEDIIYLGRYERYGDSYKRGRGEPLGKHYFFCSSTGNTYYLFKSLGKKIVKTVSTDCVENYAQLMEMLERDPMYSPVSTYKEYVPVSKERFLSGGYVNERARYFLSEGAYVCMAVNKDGLGRYYFYDYYWGYSNSDMTEARKKTLAKTCPHDQALPADEFYAKYQPYRLVEYLINGKVKKGCENE